MNEMTHIHEMIPILYQWLLAKYTSVKSFAFWNVSVELYKFRVPVYSSPPMNEMKHIHEMILILYQYLLTKYTSVKSFAFWKLNVRLYKKFCILKNVKL